MFPEYKKQVSDMIHKRRGLQMNKFTGIKNEFLRKHNYIAPLSIIGVGFFLRDNGILYEIPVIAGFIAVVIGIIINGCKHSKRQKAKL
jgi:hypothetical protein